MSMSKKNLFYFENITQWSQVCNFALYFTRYWTFSTFLHRVVKCVCTRKMMPFNFLRSILSFTFRPLDCRLFTEKNITYMVYYIAHSAPHYNYKDEIFGRILSILLLSFQVFQCVTW